MKKCSVIIEYILRKTNGIFEQEVLGQEDYQTVLRAAGKTENKQENIQDWLQLDDGEPGSQFLVFL
jgi:hypothetical protein